MGLNHACIQCPKVRDIPHIVSRKLDVEKLSRSPPCAKQILLTDSHCSPHAKIVIDTIWMLVTCLILTIRISNAPIDPNYVANQVKWEMTATNKCFPRRELCKSCKFLNLDQFPASHEIHMK